MSRSREGIICTICARAGSKGVKNKNIRELHGKPLISHTISQAKSSGLFETIAVSSDSQTVLDIATELAVDFSIRRPDELATDTADKLDAIRHAVTYVEDKKGKKFNTIVDLDPTSPLRDVQDIINALELFIEKRAENLITGAPARRSPYFNLVECDDNGFAKISKALPERVSRRQDSPRCYDMNASIYIWKRECLFGGGRVFHEKTALYVMPEERSIDIDSELDFEFVNFLMSKARI